MLGAGVGRTIPPGASRHPPLGGGRKGFGRGGPAPSLRGLASEASLGEFFRLRRRGGAGGLAAGGGLLLAAEGLLDAGELVADGVLREVRQRGDLLEHARLLDRVLAGGDGLEDALHDARGGVGAVGVALLRAEEGDVEGDDADGVVEHPLERLGRILEQERVRVLAGGHLRDADGEALGEEDRGGADRGLAPGGVGVEELDDAVGVAVEELRVLGREGGALGRDGAREAASVAADDVDLPLAHDRLAVLRRGDVALGLVERVEHARLLEDVGLGAVDVFGGALRGVEDAGAEGDDAPGLVADREHQAAVEAVAQVRGGAGAVGERPDAGGDHLLGREAVAARELVERAPLVRVVAELERLDRGGVEPAPLQVGARAGGGGRLEQAAMAERGELGVDLVEALRAGGAAVVLLRDDLHAALLREVADGVDERHAVVLHEELEDVAALAAAEALEALALRVHREARGLLVVERAAGLPRGAGALEGDAVPDHLHDVGAGADVFDDGFGDDGHGAADSTRTPRGGARRLPSRGAVW